MRVQRHLFVIVMFISGLVASPIAAVKPANSGSSFVGEDIPHQPNFLGRNICIGIDIPTSVNGWRQAAVVTTYDLRAASATHHISLSQTESVEVREDIVDKRSCGKLPLDVAKWFNDREARFCLSSWRKDRYIKVTFEAVAPKRSLKDVTGVIYSIGPCDFGDHQGYQYGDSLKVGVVHVTR